MNATVFCSNIIGTAGSQNSIICHDGDVPECKQIMG